MYHCTTTDHAGNPVECASDASLVTYAQALEAFHAFHGDPVALIETALASEPDFAMGWLMHGWLHATSTEPGARPTLQDDIARAMRSPCGPRERAHLEALRQFNEGHWTRAATHLAAINDRWPKDALALQAGHIIDFLRGDTPSLCSRIAAVLPHWRESDPGYAAVLGMHAFGLEENGDYQSAERAARESLDRSPFNAWSHHAMAHVLEMQGRSRDGIEWMRSRQPFWADDNFLAIHNYWHLALFHLETGDIDETLALFDGPIHGSGSKLMVDLVDASAMLARLQIIGIPVDGRWRAVADAWADSARPGHYAFNDFHTMLAWLGAGRDDEAETWLKAQGTTGYDPDSDLDRVARAVGLPLLDALHAAHYGDPTRALTLLEAVEPHVRKFGGSHAQRDLIELLLIDFALRAGQSEKAHHRLTARLARRPDGFINRQLSVRAAALQPPGTDFGHPHPATQVAPITETTGSH